ncbi:1,4-alpha-glucan branching protein [Porphyromonas canoris]|uniref:alpha amylase C-terminal domain-containing protein n=1 Tax=Porphyromonas canoris TaxID=36875 RepID=UPI00051DAECB|nr:alpha amylase C-terminal domain-containing protein [Porphyromonas canoris]KGL53312.1 1,4-alpha-glucan branching protein [Porphyromonas canoris]
MNLPIIENDPWLKPYADIINKRNQNIKSKREELTSNVSGSLSRFADGYLYFGLHREKTGWVIREWAPNATALYLLCDGNSWKIEEAFKFHPLDHGIWELSLSLNALKHGDHFKLFVEWNGGSGERIPAWAKYVVQMPDTAIFSAMVWEPESPFTFKYGRPTSNHQPLLIYECHVGMATEEEKIGTYNEFRENVLPKIAESGYNAIQLMAIHEHPYYASFGYQVSSFFAPSSKYGTPDELKALIDEAHRLGIKVIMDIVHSHAVANEVDGLVRFDGSEEQYFYPGGKGEHSEWGTKLFDYGKNEVLHFLLSNCKYWLEEFRFDGFRFDGVTSMLYLHHGIGASFCTYGDYYNDMQDENALTYLALANELVHEVYPEAVTIAEDVSGMPGLALPVKSGGYGFDYRMALNIPDFWIKIIKEYPDEHWTPGSIWWECTNRRGDEKTISYAESHDQALVGDKTIIFRLIDADMYWHMDRADSNMNVERGIALHKMIRLVTATTINGGYLNFMGNEFGHPEWIDFPREGNDWSYKYARRQWSLRENGFLRYQLLDEFDKKMIHFISGIRDFASLPLNSIWEQNEEQVLAYTRGEYMFVYNFSPSNSYTDYNIIAPSGEYEVLFSSDDTAFGGYDRIDKTVHHFTAPDVSYTIEGKGILSLYLPARTAMVLRRIEKK